MSGVSAPCILASILSRSSWCQLVLIDPIFLFITCSRPSIFLSNRLWALAGTRPSNSEHRLLNQTFEKQTNKKSQGLPTDHGAVLALLHTIMHKRLSPRRLVGRREGGFEAHHDILHHSRVWAPVMTRGINWSWGFLCRKIMLLVMANLNMYPKKPVVAWSLQMKPKASLNNQFNPDQLKSKCHFNNIQRKGLTWLTNITCTLSPFLRCSGWFPWSFCGAAPVLFGHSHGQGHSEDVHVNDENE